MCTEPEARRYKSRSTGYCIIRDNFQTFVIMSAAIGRKRKQEPKKMERKRKLEAGEEHVNTRGNPVSKKVFMDSPCNCTLNCNKKITVERRQRIFNDYYKLKWDLKSAFIMSHVESVNTKRQYTNSKNCVSKRKYTRIYKLPAFDDCEDIVVCKTFFKQTLQISDGKIDLTMKRKNINGGPTEDRRGHHEPHNKTGQEDIKFICDFINEFPSYHSHYSRKVNENRKYLPPGLNLSILYRMYKERCQDNRKPVCFSSFRSIFKNEFNLAFYVPKSDTCNQCDAFNEKLKMRGNRHWTIRNIITRKLKEQGREKIKI